MTLRIAEHTVEAAEARWIADPFIDQLRLIYLLLFTLLSILQHFGSKAMVNTVSLVPWSSFDIPRSELAEKAEGKEAEAEKRKQKLEEKAARKREMLLKSLTE